MAMIDSGLGWKCDGDYYVSAADTVLRPYQAISPALVKTNDGAAMCAVIKAPRYESYNLYIVSTVEGNVAVHNGSAADNPIYSTTYSGKTWYISMDNISGFGSNFTDFPTVVDVNENCDRNTDAGRQAIVQAITGAANVEFYSIIPSTDYVRAFVEGVEAETATRVNANKASIGTLSSLTTTDKSSLVAAINEIVGDVATKCENYTNVKATDLGLTVGVAVSFVDFLIAIKNTFGVGAYTVEITYKNSLAPTVTINGTSAAMPGATITGYFDNLSTAWKASTGVLVDVWGTVYSYGISTGSTSSAVSSYIKKHDPNDIGTLSSLTTTDKSSLVAAINEINARLNGQ